MEVCREIIVLTAEQKWMEKGEKMATTIEIRIQLTNGQFVALIPIIKLDGTRFYGERREDGTN